MESATDEGLLPDVSEAYIEMTVATRGNMVCTAAKQVNVQ